MHASRFCRCCTLAALAVLFSAPRISQAQTVAVTGFATWGASDATLGISGFTIATFETTSLPSGLLIGWNTTAGNVTPASTIPNTFNPSTQDPNGTAFVNGQWDGSNALVNTRTNQSFDYSATSNWGNIVISFSTPVTSVGFSLQQNDMDVGLLINGTSVGTLQGLTGIAPNGNRYSYIRIDGTGGTTISSVELVNGRVPTFTFNDGFIIDHLAFSAIPEPALAPALFAVGAAAAVAWRRRKII